MDKSRSLPPGDHYNANYRNFQTELYLQIRREAYGEDIGQNSWLTSEEQDRFLEWLDLCPGKTLLDVACGAGGPALRIAACKGCSVVGIDVDEHAVTTASSLAAERGLAKLAEFRATDADRPLPFPDESFDVITCIDAINHFSDRPRDIAEWAGLLKPGGRLLFTDPITLTGPMTNAEVAARSSAGFYLFVPHGYDERVIVESGLRLLMCEDISDNMAKAAEARRAARASRSADLHEIEGDQTFQGQQDFLAVAARVAREGRLSRFVYVSVNRAENFDEGAGGMPMNSHGDAVNPAKLGDVGQRARRGIAYRVLPFVFLLYVVNYIDRVNVSFANLRMSADLGFSDRVYGLGVGMFYIAYVLFEMPGAILVERWSARKWIARIMIS